ncbi:MAG TPA: helix-turn-helix transcriptional regulator [Candidatus Limnocylindria bacterium]|nr:helix-turn-helix transcriptional regulator [Candidatus Limnocylindria bacterium]
MDKVKALVEAGATIPAAIKTCLGMPVGEFADKHGLPRPVVSDVINGNRRAPDAYIAALVAEIGGTPEEWRELLWQAARPSHVPAA